MITKLSEENKKEISFRAFKNFSMELYHKINDIIQQSDTLEEILEAIDFNFLIYYDNQWLVIKEYCIPENANFRIALDCFFEDLDKIFKGVK